VTVTPSRDVHYTYAEYRGFENGNPNKHEYIAGEIYAMAGGTPDHAALAATIIARLSPQLPRGCRMFTSDLRVRMSRHDVTTYPDASIVCGGAERASDDELAITNPIVLVEVTSNSTEGYDRGRKLEFYKTIDSLREVLIVSHREPRLTVHQRARDGSWIVVEARAGESVSLESVAATLNVDDVYGDDLDLSS
jgi:Uma2 family endonuclease